MPCLEQRIVYLSPGTRRVCVPVGDWDEMPTWCPAFDERRYKVSTHNLNPNGYVVVNGVIFAREGAEIPDCVLY